MRTKMSLVQRHPLLGEVETEHPLHTGLAQLVLARLILLCEGSMHLELMAQMTRRMERPRPQHAAQMLANRSTEPEGGVGLASARPGACVAANKWLYKYGVYKVKNKKLDACMQVLVLGGGVFEI